MPLDCPAWSRAIELPFNHCTSAMENEFRLHHRRPLSFRATQVQSPYAELWMGTHPSGPSMVLLEMPWRTTTPLLEWLKLNPSIQA